MPEIIEVGNVEERRRIALLISEEIGEFIMDRSKHDIRAQCRDWGRRLTLAGELDRNEFVRRADEIEIPQPFSK